MRSSTTFAAITFIRSIETFMSTRRPTRSQIEKIVIAALEDIKGKEIEVISTK